MAFDLGPLPKSDLQDTLQTRSLNALRNLLPVSDFHFRDERIDDKGVDGVLEIKLENFYTNCRGQVQLKSTDAEDDKFNSDGSFSESIKVSNLNYLMNGHSPLYLMWYARRNQFTYAWAHDVWNQLDIDNPNWREQSTFTIRFIKPVNKEALDLIRKCILEESQLFRNIREKIARSAPNEMIKIAIDSSALSIVDAKSIYGLLLESGFTLVSNGFGKQVLESLSQLNREDANEPKIRLIAAFASLNLGQYHEAKSHIANAILLKNKLKENESHFLDYLDFSSDYAMGRIGRDEYLEKELAWAGNVTGVQALEHKLGMIRNNLHAERNVLLRKELLINLKYIADTIQQDGNALEAQKVHAKLIVFEAEGNELSTALIENATLIRMRGNMGYSVDELANKTSLSIRSQWQIYEKNFAELYQSAIKTQNPILIADCISQRCTSYLSFLMTGRMLRDGSADFDGSTAVMEFFKNEINKGMQFYHNSGCLRGEIQLKMCLADLYEICGDDVQSLAIAHEIAPIARAMNYSRMLSRALAIIEGNTELKLLQKNDSQRMSIDEIALIMTEEQMIDFAQSTVKALNVDESRYESILKDVKSGKFIAEQRRDWCKHIDLHQQLQHTNISETAYSIDPPRIAVCNKLGIRSLLNHPDYEIIVDSFKKVNCFECKFREV